MMVPQTCLNFVSNHFYEQLQMSCDAFGGPSHWSPIRGRRLLGNKVRAPGHCQAPTRIHIHTHVPMPMPTPIPMLTAMPMPTPMHMPTVMPTPTCLLAKKKRTARRCQLSMPSPPSLPPCSNSPVIHAPSLSLPSAHIPCPRKHLFCQWNARGVVFACQVRAGHLFGPIAHP